MIQYLRRSSDLLISKYSSNVLDQATQQEVAINITLIDRQGSNIVAATDSKPVEET